MLEIYDGGKFRIANQILQNTISLGVRLTKGELGELHAASGKTFEKQKDYKNACRQHALACFNGGTLVDDHPERLRICLWRGGLPKGTALSVRDHLLTLLSTQDAGYLAFIGLALTTARKRWKLKRLTDRGLGSFKTPFFLRRNSSSRILPNFVGHP